MRRKIIMSYMIFLIVLILVLFSIRFVSQIKTESSVGDLNTVYDQATDFLNDFYNQNVDDTYAQLEKRNEIFALHNGYITKDEWETTIKKNIETETLSKILKPSSASDISDILHSDEPHETYQVDFSLSVNYKGEAQERTGEIEYIKTDNGFKIHSFELDILYNPKSGRWILY